MNDADVIIVGAGPAGSACAWRLKQQGMQVLLLDKETFPRLKSCAGWITPGVLRDLQIGIEDYPYGLTDFPRFLITIKKVRFSQGRSSVGVPFETLEMPTVDLQPGAISPSMLINSRQERT